MQLSSEFLLTSLGTLGGIVFGAIVWFVKLENKTDGNSKRIDENEVAVANRILELAKSVNERIQEVSIASSSRFTDSTRAIEKNEIRIDRVESRHEQTSNEVRSMLMSIQSSLSNLEGRLSLGVKRDSDRDR